MDQKLRLDQVWLKSVFADKPDLVNRALELAERQDNAEVTISSGEITSIIQSGRRMRYEVLITTNQVTQTVWDNFFELISSKPSLATAFIGGITGTELVKSFDELRAKFIQNKNFEINCSCPNPDPRCNHALITLGTAAIMFEEDPFEFLSFRGKNRSKVVEQIQDKYSDDFSETVNIEYLRNRVVEPLPKTQNRPDKPLSPKAWKDTPPKHAPFSLEGLLKLADKASKRAWKILEIK